MILKIIHLSAFGKFERLLGSAPNIKKKSQNRSINRYVDTKPTTAEDMGASSGTSAVEKVLIGGGGEKGRTENSDSRDLPAS